MIDLLDEELIEGWRRGSARRRASIRAAVARRLEVDPRTVRIVRAGSRFAVLLRPVPVQLELAF
jgi:hypothetical protein